MQPKHIFKANSSFKDNRMKANSDKYHLLIYNIKESFQIKIDTVSKRKYEKLLEIKVDHELNFNECSHRCAARLTRN